MPQLKPFRGTQLNRTHPLARGLVGCWLMNENGGNKVYDLSGNKNHGTFVNNPLWIPGTSGPAIDFTNDAINIGDAIYNACIYNCTIVCKFLRRNLSTYGRLIDKYPGPSIYINPNTPYAVSFYGTIGEVSRTYAWTASSIIANIWYVVAVVLSPGHQRIYRNGVLAQAELDNGPFTGVYSAGTGINAYIGNRTDMTRDINGKIEYMYIYDRALSAAEIRWLYRGPFVMFAQPNSGRIAFYEGAPPGQTILDYERSVRGVNRGVMVGAA